ncbi:hypothetical protein PVT71_25620 (plasmid) [Salipiger sp. H15]|uniref:DUF2946 domain-containing protein n=1 Tax=Alloyangia sp. H15 TaxID=3029062 RepID=A0AAU8AS21_9RHOB
MLRRILAVTLVLAHLFLIFPSTPAQAASGGCAGSISALDVCEMPLGFGGQQLPGGKCTSCVLLPEASLPALELPVSGDLLPTDSATAHGSEPLPIKPPPRS